jgi:hypothetical protein
MKAVCREMNDNIPPNMELPNLLASNIENYLMFLTRNSMEAQLDPKERLIAEDTVVQLIMKEYLLLFLF